MKKIYLASASLGDRILLKAVADRLADEHVLYVPMLGFMGIDETAPAFRSQVMDIDIRILKEWAEVLVILFEGLASIGIWEEALAMDILHRPVAIFRTRSWTIPDTAEHFACFGFMEKIEEWLNGL